MADKRIILIGSSCYAKGLSRVLALFFNHVDTVSSKRAEALIRRGSARTANPDLRRIQNSNCLIITPYPTRSPQSVLSLIRGCRDRILWSASVIVLTESAEQAEKLKRAGILGDHDPGKVLGRLDGHAVSSRSVSLSWLLETISTLSTMMATTWFRLKNESVLEKLRFAAVQPNAELTTLIKLARKVDWPAVLPDHKLEAQAAAFMLRFCSNQKVWNRESFMMDLEKLLISTEVT